MHDPREPQYSVLDVTLRVWSQRLTGRLLGPPRHQRRHIVRFVDGGVIDPAQLTWLNGMAHQPGADFVPSRVDGRPERRMVARLLLTKAPRGVEDVDPQRQVSLDGAFPTSLDEFDLDVELMLMLDERPTLAQARAQLFSQAWDQLQALIGLGIVRLEQLEDVDVSIEEEHDLGWLRQEYGRQLGSAHLALEVGNWAEAGEALDRAERLGLETAELHLEKAWIVLNTPRRDRREGEREARSRLARALALDPDGEHQDRCLDVLRLLVSRSTSRGMKLAR